MKMRRELFYWVYWVLASVFVYAQNQMNIGILVKLAFVVNAISWLMLANGSGLHEAHSNNGSRVSCGPCYARLKMDKEERDRWLIDKSIRELRGRIDELEDFIHDYIATDAMTRDEAREKAKELVPRWF